MALRLQPPPNCLREASRATAAAPAIPREAACVRMRADALLWPQARGDSDEEEAAELFSTLKATAAPRLARPPAAAGSKLTPPQGTKAARGPKVPSAGSNSAKAKARSGATSGGAGKAG